MKHSTTTPRIYVASLSAYNSGRIFGGWVNVDGDADAIRDQITAMLATSKEEVAEEWVIHYHEGFPSGYVKECSDIDDLAAMSELIEKHGLELVTAALTCADSRDANAVGSLIEDNYSGSFDHGGIGGWAQEHCEDCGSVPKNLPSFIACHIDWDGVGRGLLHDYQYSEVNGTTYLFSNC